MLVIDFYQMCLLLKEPFLATYSAMSNPNSMKQGVVAPKRAFFNILLPCLEPPPQLALPCAKRDQCIFAHFSSVTFFAQNFLIPCTSSCLLCGFTFDFKKNLSSCHKSSIGLRSGLSGGGTPPVNIFFFEESLCLSGRMFRVIILHEPVIGNFFLE